MVPTESPNANTISQTDLSVQGNLLREYEQKFADRPEDQKLTKLCSHAGFLKNIRKGQFFITLDEENVRYLARNQDVSRARGWIRGNTKIGPVLEVKVYFHQGRYCVDIMIESLFRDRTVSWVRVVNGINKYVTETSEENPIECVEHVRTGKPVAKAKPRPKLAVTLSPVSIPTRERKRIDISSATYSQGGFEVSKCMIRLLRHDETIPREDDGAARFDDLIEEFVVKFGGTSQWTVHAWITFSAKGGGPKKRFQYCLNPNSSKTLGHSGGHRVDPTLQEMYCCRVTSPSTSTTTGTLMNCTPSLKVD